jgi:hypothetical protein
MKFTQSLIALAACILPLVAGAPVTEPHLKIRNPTAQDVIPNSYIVVFNKGIEAEEIDAEFASVNSILSKRSSTLKGIGHKYNLAEFNGYQIETDTATIGEIASSPQASHHTNIQNLTCHT